MPTSVHDPVSDRVGSVRSGNQKLYSYTLLAVFAFICLQVIFGSPYAMTLDGPSHAYNGRVLYELWTNPNSVFHRFYQVRTALLPNWGGLIVQLGLDRIWNPITGEKAMVVLCLLLNLAGVGSMLAAAKAKVDEGLLLLLPIWLNGFIFLGFFGFSIGFGLSCFLIALFVRSGPVKPLHLLSAFLLSACIWFCHPMPLLIAIAVGAFSLLPQAYEAFASGTWRMHVRANLARLLLLIVSVLPVLLAVLISGASVLHAGGGPPFDSPSNILWGAFDLYAGRGWVNPIVPHDLLAGPAVLIVACCGALAISERRLASRAWIGPAALFLVAAIILGNARGDAMYVKPRLLLYAFVLLGVAVARTLSTRSRRLVTVGLIAPYFLMFVYIHWTTQRAAVAIPQQIKALVPVIPKGSTMAGLIVTNVADLDNERLAAHLPERLAMAAGAIDLSNYEGHTTHFPLEYKYGQLIEPRYHELTSPLQPDDLDDARAQIAKLQVWPDTFMIVWNDHPSDVESRYAAEELGHLLPPAWHQVASSVTPIANGAIRISLWKR